MFGTPQLLMLSGIGCPAHLAEHGIPVRVARDGVGQNLQDHVDYVACLATPGKAFLGSSLKASVGVVGAILPWTGSHTGVMPPPYSPAGRFMHVAVGAPAAQLQQAR